MLKKKPFLMRKWGLSFSQPFDNRDGLIIITLKRGQPEAAASGCPLNEKSLYIGAIPGSHVFHTS